jgi:2-dehydropantoate 2-reductase
VAPSDPSPMAVFGTGALACAIGARLARGGDGPVTLVGAWEEGRQAITDHGIIVHEPEGTWSVRVSTAPLEQTPRPVDLVLVLAKSPRTATIAPYAARALSPSGLVLTLQNGLGNREALEASAGPGRVAVGVALFGATLVGPGEVRVVPGLVILGDEPGREEVLGLVATRLRHAGIGVDTTPNVPRLIWRKLVANCAINPVTALANVPNGALLEDSALHARLLGAASEVGAVAGAKGIDLGADPQALAVQLVRATASNRSSMLQDLARGAVTEIDALNGAVAAEGRRLGVPVPENESLWRQVREREGRPVPPEPGGAEPGDTPGATGTPA